MSADGFRKVGHGTFVRGRLITAQQSDIRVAMGKQGIQYAPVYVRETDLAEPEPASRQALARQRLNNLIALAHTDGALDAKHVESECVAILSLLDNQP